MKLFILDQVDSFNPPIHTNPLASTQAQPGVLSDCSRRTSTYNVLSNQTRNYSLPVANFWYPFIAAKESQYSNINNFQSLKDSRVLYTTQDANLHSTMYPDRSIIVSPESAISTANVPHDFYGANTSAEFDGSNDDSILTSPHHINATLSSPVIFENAKVADGNKSEACVRQFYSYRNFYSPGTYFINEQ